MLAVFAPLQPPEAVQLEALATVQEREVELSGSIVLGVAEKEMVGGLIVTVLEIGPTVPPGPLQVRE